MAWLEREMKSLQGGGQQPVPPPPPWEPPVAREKPKMEVEDEALRSVPIIFPKLPEATSRTAALEAGDWLAQLAPLVGDVSQRAATWWSGIMSRCMELYRQWLTASPLERLHMETPEVEDSSYRRLERVTALLLAAVPDTLKQELVAARQLHTAAILLRVLKTEAVEQLRLWRRQVLRAKELQVVLPDATLDQASFRVSAFRMSYQVDVQPCETTVGYLYDILMAEAEQMRLAGELGVSIKEKTQPAVKKVGTTQPSGGGKCRGWGTEHGCRFGQRISRADASIVARLITGRWNALMRRRPWLG